MLQVPIFHVNGDDPEAIVYIMQLALRFRREFKEDCIVDIFCYRRHGHNEEDEPSYTHPRMYRVINGHASIATLYGGECDRRGAMSALDQEEWRKNYRATLKASLEKAREADGAGAWAPTAQPAADIDGPRTAVTEDSLRMIAASLTAVPAGFNIHPKLLQIVNNKARALREKNTVDWAFAEALAFGGLVLEGFPVRLSGEDSGRGTFSQRHLVWWDAESPSPRPFTPLNALGRGQAAFSVFDSPLSEYAVLGFEYGYSVVAETALTIWEAQFGDFSNGAQVIIDNYIACAEKKWGQKSGLTLLLPHANEGQGPDHSSGHLERFLQLCARNNLRVCNATTPAQYFHLLRRQALDKNRKPLVIMSPKSLLRHPLAVSPAADLSTGAFRVVLDDAIDNSVVTRVLLCSGKVYYDLFAEREKTASVGTAIIRLEQLYPFPSQALASIIGQYAGAREIIWVQEEHKNYGAWRFIVENLQSGLPVRYLGRPEAESAATGKMKEFKEEQRAIVANAFKKEQCMKINIVVPAMGESISAGTIVDWLKPSGASVKETEPLFEFETDKATVQVPAQAGGVLEILVPKGAEVAIGQTIAVIDTQEDIAPSPTSPPPTAARAGTPAALSPAVRRVLDENNLEAAAVAGSGKGGRITKADAITAAKSRRRYRRNSKAEDAAGRYVARAGSDDTADCHDRASQADRRASRSSPAANRST